MHERVHRCDNQCTDDRKSVDLFRNGCFVAWKRLPCFPRKDGVGREVGYYANIFLDALYFSYLCWSSFSGDYWHAVFSIRR